MKKKEQKHTKNTNFANRVGKILWKLNADLRPTVKELAEEFNTSERTIFRDMNERLTMFPITRDSNGGYMFEPDFSLGENKVKSNEELLVLLLSLSQFEEADGSFKEISKNIIDKLIKSEIRKEFFIKPEFYEKIDFNKEKIKILKEAINHTKVIRFNMKANPTTAHPYKITNYDGIWYLFAKDIEENRNRNILIANMTDIEILNERFIKEIDVDKALEDFDTAFSSSKSEPFDVIVKIKPKIADFFTLKKHLKSQQINETLEDGSVIVSFTVSQREDLDNLIKSWLPDIEVLKPVWFRKKILKDLKGYIKEMEKEMEIEK